MKSKHSPRVLALAQEFGYVPFQKASLVGGCIILGAITLFTMISYGACYMNVFPLGLCKLDDRTFLQLALSVGVLLGFVLALIHSLIWFFKNIRALKIALEKITEEMNTKKSNRG